MEQKYELYHHGILGMHWGIRRYQNPDGSLTPAGKKRYASDSGEIIYKDLRQQVRDHRQKNRFMRDLPIGENSKKIVEESNKKRKEWQNTPEYKAWKRELDAFEESERKKFDRDPSSFDQDEYGKRLDKILSRQPKKNFNDVNYGAKILNGNKWKYVDDYINRGGKDLSIAYIKDLGYDQKTAEYFVKEMIKKGRTLGDI